MEPYQLLHNHIFSEKNNDALTGIIIGKLGLPEKAVPKCKGMVTNFLKKNMEGYKGRPASSQQAKEVFTKINERTLDDIFSALKKKYPHLDLGKKKQVSRVQFEREQEVSGGRKNHVMERPNATGKKTYYDEEDEVNMEMNNLGYDGVGESGGNYASAFSNPSITNVPVGQKQFFNGGSQRNSSEMEQRYQQMINDRNYSGRVPRPETPDFTLDGS